MTTATDDRMMEADRNQGILVPVVICVNKMSRLIYAYQYDYDMIQL